ncbi:serine hydrolase domain-containing protein [Brumimicrobium mesophilum]|uniref:serine hydrolase domain-containing protein n=1 Tax=Brumimicrobium mesophilum TaxID=392717 RepID=UPI000D143C0B|nr:serine hydrolase domain-containing protein [Brumimicrobium mesophilum]
MKNHLFFALIIVFFSSFSLSQSFDKKKLDGYFNTLEKNNKFMGSVAVSQNGIIIYTKSVGFSDVKNQIRNTHETKFRIGSISKTFTAVLVLNAIEDRKLTINQHIDKFFPSIKHAEQISILQLLNHSSGISNFTNDKNFVNYYTLPKTREELIQIIADGGSDFKPGKKAEYSNSNYVLLTLILEKIYDKTLDEILSKYITQPLGLNNTFMGSKISTLSKDAKSYYYNEGWQEQVESDMSIPLGAGGIVSTPSDIVKFSDALFAGSLLNSESVNLMKTIKEDYGVGLFSFSFKNKMGYGHDGAIDGFKSSFYHFSKGKISYSVISNGLDIDLNFITNGVLNVINNEPFAIPSFQEYKVRSEILEHYIGTYSSDEIPIKIKISRNENKLIAQGTDQPELILVATGEHEFKFDQAGAIFTFIPTRNEMILNQDGRDFLFRKK